MATKKYNIIFLLIIIILCILMSFAFPQQPKYLNSHNQFISNGVIEGYSTEITPYKTQLLQKQQNIKRNWGITFTVKINSIANDNQWRQIIGITPDNNGADKRFFGAWLYPNSNNIYFRTATLSSWDDNIFDQSFPLKIGNQYRFYVISNLSDKGDTQNIIVQVTNITDNIPTKQIANVMLNAPLYISSTGSKLGLQPAQIDTPNINIYTSYSSFLPIDGTIKDVVFASSVNYPILAVNLENSINKLNMDANANIREGLDNIGGTGNNGYISGITPPTTLKDSNGSTITIQAPVNYEPIVTTIAGKSGAAKQLCATSVINTTDASFGWISTYGYNYPISFNANGSVASSVPICSPDDLYTIQTVILKQLNDFNSDYSNFIKYKYNKQHEVAGDKSQKLTYVGLDDAAANTKYKDKKTIDSLDGYALLSKNLQTYSNLLKANKAYYPNPDQSKTDLESIDPYILAETHKKILEERNQLDAKLFELNNIQNTVAGESKMTTDSSIYITLLLTTLATSIVYFVFI